MKADTDHTSFLTGTLSLKEENEVLNFCLFDLRFAFLCCLEFWCVWIEFHLNLFQVHLIRLSSDGTELVCEGLFSHPNEIWDLASCPFDQRIFSTVFSSGNWLISCGISLNMCVVCALNCDYECQPVSDFIIIRNGRVTWSRLGVRSRCYFWSIHLCFYLGKVSSKRWGSNRILWSKWLKSAYTYDYNFG